MLERYGFLMSEHDDVLLIKDDETTNYEEAMSDIDSKKWLKAMKSQMYSMYDNQVWTLVDPSNGIKPIRYKWVFKKKTNMEGNMIIYKAMLLAKDYKQR